MRLSEFILTHRAQILTEWDAFARTLLPASQALSLEELRAHAEGLLVAIADDLERPQTRERQAEKSKGKADARGAVRAGKGFTLAQRVSEFRALRASVLRLWTEDAGEGGTNVAEMTRFNEAIDQALAQSSERFVEDLERSKDLFLGILGHDLRNPLAAVTMSASQLLRQVAPDAPEAKNAARIVRSSNRMQEIINDLLDFTRARLGSGMPVFRERRDLEALCRQTVDEVRAVSPQLDLRLETSGELTFDFDGPRMSQALSNLLGNAVQHGAPDAPITVEARGEAAQVVLSVHNRGAPIPRAQLNELFLPLKRGGRARTGSSLGLGLFIAKEIVVAHGGVIQVESSAEGGTTVRIELPRFAPQEEEAGAAP